MRAPPELADEVREAGQLEAMIKAAVLSVKGRFDVAPQYLSTQIMQLGDHGRQGKGNKATGRISVEKFQ